jgi:hypothetical protein
MNRIIIRCASCKHQYGSIVCNLYPSLKDGCLDTRPKGYKHPKYPELEYIFNHTYFYWEPNRKTEEMIRNSNLLLSDKDFEI